MFDRPMFFELVVRRFLGEKAYHIASSENFDQYRNRWLRKVAKKILFEIETIDTYDEHKKQLHLFADKFRDSLGRKSPDQQQFPVKF